MKTTFKAMGVCACLALLTSVAVFGGSASGKAHSAATFKVGLVTDTGGLNDRSFNHLAYLGVQRAKAKLGVQVQVLTSKSDADYVPNLTTLAQQGYNLIIPVGFLMADATDTVAKAVPSSKFAVIDVGATTLKDKPKNVEGLIFKEQEAGYLAGYLAGLVAKAKGYKTISSVGGQKIPPVDHYIAGYQAGAKAADPGIKTLNGYSQDFAAQDKCKEIALNQIAKGSKVVFQVAGGCGLGALDAAKQKKLQGIGVDADQGYLGSYILTSAEKKVDVAVYNAIADALKGKFAAGKDRVNDIANGGVGYGKINAVGKPYQGKLVAIRKKIAKGQIKNIPDTVK